MAAKLTRIRDKSNRQPVTDNQEIIRIIREMKDGYAAKTDEALRDKNSVAFDVYIERGIALHDLLVRLGVDAD